MTMPGAFYTSQKQFEYEAETVLRGMGAPTLTNDERLRSTLFAIFLLFLLVRLQLCLCRLVFFR